MIQDLRFAIRTILSHQWFSGAIVLTLALGIGVNTTVFTLVNAVLFKPIPLPGGARLVVISGQDLNRADSRFGVSYPDFLEFQKNNTAFDGMEATRGAPATISEAGNPASDYRMSSLSWRMFEMLRTPPVLGRGFTAADSVAGAPTVALISHRVWQNRYGGARNIVGRVVRLNGQPATLIGVMPEGFRFTNSQDVWTPLVPTPAMEVRSNRPLQIYGLLKPGVTPAQASADLNVIAKRIANTFPDTNKTIGVTVQSFHQAFNGGNIRAIFLTMLGAVGFVLLIACANVANMMLSKALGRRREISLRAALGASRWQLIRQLLIEAVLLSVAGGLLGLALSTFGVRYFDQATVEVRPSWIAFDMDWVAFAYFAALAIGSGIVFGLFPAIRATQVDLNSDLKEGTRAAGRGVRSGWVTGGLVVIQFALTVVLLSAAGLMVRSFFNAQALNPFLPVDRILTARISLPSAKGDRFEDRAKRMRFYEDLRPKLAAMPGVTHAAFANSLPGLGTGDRRLEIEGRAKVEPGRAPRALHMAVSPGYFDAIGLRLEAGRDFTDQDGGTGRYAAIATREFAQRFFPGEAAIGKRFRIFGERDDPGEWIEIVGVSGDIVQNIVDRDSGPLFFVPHRQEGWAGMAVILRTNGSPAAQAVPARAVVQGMDPDLPVFELLTFPEAQERQRWFLRVFGSLFFLFALIGLLIAALGIYAVVAQGVASRTREIGIRMALGATASAILRRTLARGLIQLMLGLTVGLVGAYAATQLLGAFLVKVDPRDPAVLGAVALLLVGIGVFASWLPARRAALLNPVQALRDE